MRFTKSRLENMDAYVERYKKNTENLANTVRQFREKFNCTRYKLSTLSGVNHTTICKIEEQGRAQTETLFDLADALNHDITIQFVPRASIKDELDDLSI